MGCFWITGLPRSRTAWFALAMRGPYSVCFHELTAKASSFEHLKVLWTNRTEPHRGNSDSACALHASRIIAELAPRTLVIERPVGEVLASLESLYRQPLPHMARVLEQAQAALRVSSPLIKRVRFADLEDRDALIEAADWLVPGHGETAALVMDRNVQISPRTLADYANAPHSGWHLKEAA